MFFLEWAELIVGVLILIFCITQIFGAQAMMEFLSLKAAKDLGLDMSVKGTTVQKTK